MKWCGLIMASSYIFLNEQESSLIINNILESRYNLIDFPFVKPSSMIMSINTCLSQSTFDDLRNCICKISLFILNNKKHWMAIIERRAENFLDGMYLILCYQYK